MLKILIVDDEVLLLNLLQDILEGEGYKVSTAVDAVDAIDLMQFEHFDIVLTDYDMPHLSGAELSVWIRKNRPEAKVIISTGMPELTEQSSWDYVLDKPYEYDNLLKLLSDIKHLKLSNIRSANF